MKILRDTLANGAKLVLSDLRDSNSLTLFILIQSGTREEKIPGLAHFIEHAVFKGTKKRPSASVINNEIERVGGYMNAATSQEFTEYYIKIPNEFYEKAFSILSDILVDATFDEAELEKEKDVIIEEINMYDDMPIRSVSDTFYSLVWPQSYLGRSILGTPETVKSVTRQDILDYVYTNYTPSNMIISIAGNLADKRIEQAAYEYFGHFEQKNEKIETAKTTHISEAVPENIAIVADDEVSIRFEKKNVRQAHFCFGIESLSYKDERQHALDVASSLLAEGSGSYLWQKVREELGASYYLNSEIDAFAQTGIWYIHAGVDKDKLVDVIQIIKAGIQKLKAASFNTDELVRAKEYLKGDLVMNLEGSEEIARNNAHEILEHNIIIPLEEEKVLIDAVNLDEVHNIINNLYSNRIYFNILTKQADIHTLKEVVHLS